MIKDQSFICVCTFKGGLACSTCILNHRRLPLAQVTFGLRSIWFRPLLDAFQQAWEVFKECSVALRKPKFYNKMWQTMGHPLSFSYEGIVSSDTDNSAAGFHPSRDRWPVSLFQCCRVAKPTGTSDTARFILGSEDQPGPFRRYFPQPIVIITNHSGG